MDAFLQRLCIRSASGERAGFDADSCPCGRGVGLAVERLRPEPGVSAEASGAHVSSWLMLTTDKGLSCPHCTAYAGAGICFPRSAHTQPQGQVPPSPLPVPRLHTHPVLWTTLQDGWARKAPWHVSGGELWLLSEIWAAVLE